MRHYIKQTIAWALLTAIFLTVLHVLPASVIAQRRASLVPPADTWLLDFQLHGPPQKINVTLPGEHTPKTYWYLLYTITNHTGREVDFYPRFDLFTDTFKLYHAGINVRRVVFDAVRRRYANTIPLLEPQHKLAGNLLLGEDNARDSVAFFDDFDPNSNAVKIFVSGLSSEIVKIKSPTALDPQTNQPRQVLLRRTLMLEYQVPGDPLNPDMRVMLYRNRSWVLR